MAPRNLKCPRLPTKSAVGGHAARRVNPPNERQASGGQVRYIRLRRTSLTPRKGRGKPSARLRRATGGYYTRFGGGSKGKTRRTKDARRRTQDRGRKAERGRDIRWSGCGVPPKGVADKPGKRTAGKGRVFDDGVKTRTIDYSISMKSSSGM